MPETKPIKSGAKTSEFWGGLLPVAAAPIVATLMKLDSNVQMAAIAAAAIVASVYIYSRAKTKAVAGAVLVLCLFAPGCALLDSGDDYLAEAHQAALELDVSVNAYCNYSEPRADLSDADRAKVETLRDEVRAAVAALVKATEAKDE